MSDRPVNDGTPWTRDQLILAFDLYCRIPFQRTKAGNPRVRELAGLIGRTVSSIARKLGNFGAFDPQLAQQMIVGLTHGSKLDKEIWNEFHQDWSSLVSEADRLKTLLLPPISADQFTRPVGPSVRIATVEQRVHQAFFREAVLSSYNFRCCITGLTITECLIAGHIMPWSVSESRRTDPSNGLCLSATFDRLFDAGFLAVSDDLTIVFSKSLHESKDPVVCSIISLYAGKKINLPLRFMPDPICLKWHRETTFRSK